MRILALILISNIIIAQIPVEKDVIEWCLECDDKVTTLHKRLDNKDSVIENKDAQIDSQQETINILKETNNNLIEKDSIDGLILANKDIILSEKGKEIRKIKTNRWLERVITVGLIVIAILI